MVTKKLVSLTLRLKVETGSTSQGFPIYAARNINGLNPEKTADDVHAVGTTLANL